MNRFLAAVCAALVVCGFTAGSEEIPQKIPQYAQDCRSHEWYEKQLKLWRGVIALEPKNADAWYQLYKAQRYFFFEDKDHNRHEKQKLTEKLLEEMKNAVPESAEYNLAYYRAGGADPARFPALEKAYKLRPQFTELYEELVVYYELTGDIDKRNYFVKMLYDGRSLAPQLFDFGYNLLMSLDNNAVILVGGDNDTYPLWILQAVMGIRTDVTIMNTGLIFNDAYRSAFLKRNGITADADLLSEAGIAKAGRTTALQQFIKSVAEGNPAKPLHTALTLDPDATQRIKDDLYITGLAYKYSPKRFDNIAVLKNNWAKFRLDNLTLQFYTENTGYTATRQPYIDVNYVAPAMILYEHYALSGETVAAGSLRRLVLRLGRAAGQGDEVAAYLNEAAAKQPEAPEMQPAHGENDIILSPNPAMNSLTITLPAGLAATVNVADMRGLLVATWKADRATQTFPITDLAPGVYTLQFFTGQGAISKVLHIAR